MPDRDPARPRRAGSKPFQAESGLPLPTGFATGPLDEKDAAELRALKLQIRSASGFCCEGYKERVLRRRLAVRMRALGLSRYAEYAAQLERDAEEYHRLLDTVTINVSKFFRNASTWALLRDSVLPQLFALETPVVNIWSAGTAAGEEAYSIAILVLQYAARTGEKVDRFRILGTDVDANALARARDATYANFAFTEMSDGTRTRWFEGPGRRRVRPEVRALVRFAVLDLMTESMPVGQHLVLCRNVLIYFERDVQERMFQGFHDALVPGGWLQLGKVETLLGTAPSMFRTVSARERLFRRT
ncbi:MAG: protein-glutamate O-methyltransferase CheR [Gemmatimonadetes bacterium]|nr:protein-glutamate O-methyltransferase CheR [Gemmatimonadota bacterium]